MSFIVSQQENGNICIQGAITFENVAPLQKEMLALLQKNQLRSEFQVDLQQVSLVNSAALGLLVELKKWNVRQHKKIKFLHLPERLLSLAQLCNVANWLGLEAY